MLSIKKQGTSPGFTHIELLAVIGIFSTLIALGVGTLQRGYNSALMTREIQAARILVTALQTSAIDNNGHYIAGMDYRTGSQDNPVLNLEGQAVLGHAAQRYPFRLAPYLDQEFDNTVFVNRNKAEILKSTGGKGPMYDYQVSTYPALGMNIFCVGGVVFWDGSTVNADDCISSTANTMGSIIAFASGGSGMGKARRRGFSYVTPPTKSSGSPYCIQWSSPDSWTSEKDPMNYGWVDFRYNGKAVVAFLDGSTRLCSVEELSDMRLWTRSAHEANDSQYSLND